MEDQKQATISRYSVEVEYRSMATTYCELQWLSYLLKDFHILVKLLIPLQYDSQAATAIGKNLMSHDKVKHVEIDCHLVRDLVDNGFIITPYIHTLLQQLADLFTKEKSFTHMLPYLYKMGLQ